LTNNASFLEHETNGLSISSLVREVEQLGIRHVWLRGSETRHAIHNDKQNEETQRNKCMQEMLKIHERKACIERIKKKGS
jgi:hypothetical protein